MRLNGAAVSLGAQNILKQAGVPVLFYLIKMLANMGGRLEPLRHATLFSLCNPKGLLARDFAALWRLVVLAGLGLLLNAAGIMRCFPG